ncbi:putative TPR repeat:RNA-processing protein [Desulfamplus magnetovallimortis]|uniref:Putative TPR repeat:RNA-processing protein n=1 Tax=Desulfamplus magnetovallimortis TaxID=1246637 RepID=A0A1W1HBS4_9BACT|nr:tetratricopeptide repeat protein [Desulfamplus magnetovallimortis]SLM29930.1 putative TPR repeat:RNA-processing protein [Desulfamplus magnetovallimortis]
MGLFGFLSRKTPESFEKKGDSFFDKGAFGYAKIEYEKAREYHLEKPSEDVSFGERIAFKIIDTSERLAITHKEKALEYIELGCFNDARDLLSLALELVHNPDLKAEILHLGEVLSECEKTGLLPGDSGSLQGNSGNLPGGSGSLPRGDGSLSGGSGNLPGDSFNQAEITSKEFTEDSQGNMYDGLEAEPNELQETFFALCSTLDETRQIAYADYGQDFVSGFVLLNEGEFEEALDYLLRALEKNSHRKTHIPLEIAVCYLNMGEYSRSKVYGEIYLGDFPGSESGWHLMCESFWSAREYEGAHEFLDRLMSDGDYEGAVALALMKGETFFLEGKFTDAAEFYQKIIENEPVGDAKEPLFRSLARTFHALGEYEKAKDIYAALMNSCGSCGRMPDFATRFGFAEASFALGVRTTQLLEIFLKLAQEDPDKRSLYYRRAADIYDAQGHEDESRRFMEMAQSLE